MTVIVRKRIDIIYNPAAGFRNRKRFEFLLNELEENGARPRVHETSSGAHATELARHIAARGDTDILVVAGGDGTINDVVNGLGHTEVPLAVLPLGTANVLAIEIGLPRASAKIAHALMRGQAREIALGQANGRLFLLWVGAGLDAEITALLSPGLKKRWGKASYVWAGLKYFLKGPGQAIDIRVNDENFRAGWVIVANACCYAGRFKLAPKAHLCNREFIATICPPMNRRRALRYLIALGAGRLHRLKDVRVIPCERVEFLAPVGAPIQIDGEGAGLLPQEIRLSPLTLPLIFP